MSKANVGFFLFWVASVSGAYYLGQEKVTFASASQYFSDDIKKLSSAKADDERLWQIIHSNPKQKNDVDKISSDPTESFDLYSLLPNMNIVLDGDKVVSTQANNKTDHKAKLYMLQAGAFGKQSDAERFKVNLALLGLESAVQKVQTKGKVAYRVRVGPYKNKQTLTAANNLLKKNGINAFAVLM